MSAVSNSIMCFYTHFYLIQYIYIRINSLKKNNPGWKSEDVFRIRFSIMKFIFAGKLCLHHDDSNDFLQLHNCIIFCNFRHLSPYRHFRFPNSLPTVFYVQSEKSGKNENSLIHILRWEFVSSACPTTYYVRYLEFCFHFFFIIILFRIFLRLSRSLRIKSFNGKMETFRPRNCQLLYSKILYY